MEVTNQDLVFRWIEDEDFGLIAADVLVSHDIHDYRILGTLFLSERNAHVMGYTYAHNVACNHPEPGEIGLVNYVKMLDKINAFVKDRKDVVLSENDFDFITLEKDFKFLRALQKNTLSKFILENHIRPTLVRWLEMIMKHGSHDDVMRIKKVEVEL